MKLHQKLFRLLVFLLPIQLGRHFWPTWSYTFGLKIDYFSPTAYLTDFLVLAVLGLWGIDKLKATRKEPFDRAQGKQRVKSKDSKYVFLFFSFFTFLVINC